MAGHEMNHRELIHELVEALERLQTVVGLYGINRPKEYPLAEKATREIHGASREAYAVLEKAKLIEDCVPTEAAYEAAMDHGH